MKYEVLVVDDDALPKGMHQVIVEREDLPPLLLINGDVAECWEFMRAWEDTMEPSWQPSVSTPFKGWPLRLAV